MRRTLLRALLAIATFTVVWLVATPARATGAPVCDPRGAIVFAPPPQQQDPETSLDIVVNDDDCTQSPLERKNVVPNRAPPSHAGIAAQEPATAATVIAFSDALAVRVPAPDATAPGARPGFRHSVDRPPRG